MLGDREKNTAKVVFTSGALVHEDYEFTIVDFPAYDTSKSYQGAQSHWRLKLAKSDAELEATGLYVPSTKKQGKAGDTIAFIGTEMTHVPYVTDAEIRLDDWKKDRLGEIREIKPTLVVNTDRVRLNNEGRPDALISQLRREIQSGWPTSVSFSRRGRSLRNSISAITDIYLSGAFER